jgi:hypothetical protein
MARKPVNTTTTEAKTNRREYNLDHWVEEAQNATSSATRRAYAYAQSIVRLCKDADEQSTPAEDAAYLAGLVSEMATVATAKALAADAKAGRGVAEVAKRRDQKATINALQAQVAALMAQLAAATPAAPEAPAPKRSRKPVG